MRLRPTPCQPGAAPLGRQSGCLHSRVQGFKCSTHPGIWSGIVHGPENSENVCTQSRARMGELQRKCPQNLGLGFITQVWTGTRTVRRDATGNSNLTGHWSARASTVAKWLCICAALGPGTPTLHLTVGRRGWKSGPNMESDLRQGTIFLAFALVITDSVVGGFWTAVDWLFGTCRDTVFHTELLCTLPSTGAGGCR